MAVDGYQLMAIGNYFKRIFPDVNHARRDASLEISVQQSVQRGFAMYLARERINTKINYFLRVSYSDGERMKSREICDLGSHPEQFIVYPYDGTSFYFDPALIKQIEDAGVKPETESLERVFWPFLHPETRRVIEMFSRPPSGRKQSLKKQAERCKTAAFHIFDKRRMHYLRFGGIDMSGIGHVPPKIYRKLLDKSRDEIEQQFMEMENVLENREKKNYVYAAFNVAGHFESEISRKFPQALDQEKVDRVFLEELCTINADESFWGDLGISEGLNGYLLRYLFWFFDLPFEGGVYLDDLMWRFRQRHHGFRPTQGGRPPMPVDEALSVMGLSGQDPSKMTIPSMTRQYRVMAQKYHPDKGGDHDQFIRLNRAFQDLLKKVRR